MTIRPLEVSFRNESVETATDVLAACGGTNIETERSHGLTGIEVVLVAVVGIRGLGEFVAQMTRAWKCGVIVDTRGSSVHTEKNCDLPRGDVLVITSDGQEVTLHEPAGLDLEALINAASR
jgi:hypothetical protein